MTHFALDAGWHRRIGVLLGLLILTWSARGFAEPPQGALKALEDEINVLKETHEQTNNQVKQLKERLQKAEQDNADRAAVIKELQRRVEQLEALKKDLQDLEAKLKEGKTGPAKRGADDPDFGSKDGLYGRFRVEARLRPELQINVTDLNSNADDKDAIWGHRVRLGADVGFSSWVRARVDVQESGDFGRAADTLGTIGLHQGYAEVRPTFAPGLWLRGGRSEMAFGSERLVGRDDFSASGRFFDGALIHYGYDKYIEADVFYAKLRESPVGQKDADQDFFGVYLTTKAIPYTTLDLYWFGLVDEILKPLQVGTTTVTQSFSTNLHTVGARVGALFPFGLLAEVEAAFQFGSRTDPNDATKELSHYGMAFYAELGYQAPVITYPTIAAFFAWASGDGNPKDGKSNDFQPLFPSRYGFLGAMNLFQWANLMDVGGKLELSPPMGFGFHASVHYFLLVNDQGTLFGLGTGKTPDQGASLGRNVGLEIDTWASWAWNEHFQLRAGYSAFVPKTVPDRLKLGTDVAHWAYFQAVARY